jgi:outer membrane lipoprotein-sorting protein
MHMQGAFLAGASVVATLALGAPPATGSDAANAVEAFLDRVANVEIRDLTIDQQVTVYHLDGLHPSVRGDQRVLIKPPGRQRVEQTVEGKREIRLAVNGRVWVRRGDGTTSEARPTSLERDSSGLFVTGRRTVEQLLEEWRALGIQTDVDHVEQMGTRTVTIIGARAGDRDSPSAWLDHERGVVRFITRERTAAGLALVDRVFTEHRPLVGGLSFPWRQETFVGGRLLLVVNVRAVTANAGLPDTLFDPGALRRER